MTKAILAIGIYWQKDTYPITNRATPVLPTKWTPEKKREYARERYRKLKRAKPASKASSKRPRIEKFVKSERRVRKPLVASVSKHRDAPLPDSTKIEITGNPFVDTGLATIAVRRKLASLDDLTLGDLRRVHKEGVWLAEQSESLKCFTMIFTTNSLLRNPSIKDRNKRINMQAAITSAFLNDIGRETQDEYCEACGNEHTVNLTALTNEALSNLGEEQQDRFIGRDWFPLAGSIGSDAQALPAASRDPSLCAKCLFAVQYLPLGVRLFGRELAVFQSTSTKFWYGVLQDIARQIESRIDSGNNEIVGSKQGRAGLAIQLLDHFKQLQISKKDSNLEQDTRLYAWRFANSTAPNLEIDEIPSHALLFLYDATKWGVSKEITDLMKMERVSPDRTFFASIMARKEYYGLYPGKIGKEKGYRGASHELFILYQTKILGRTLASLKASFEVARLGFDQQEKEWNAALTRPGKKRMEENEWTKEVERLTRSEAFREPVTRSRYRKIMAELARSGKFDLKAYSEIFPNVADDSVIVSQDGWNLIRYYTGMIARKKELDFHEEEVKESSPTMSGIQSSITNLVYGSAQAIFLNYVNERGEERFESDVLKRIERGKLGVNWLRIQFIKLARQENGFNAVSWKKLCHPKEAKWTISELLFQYRLLWSKWLNQRPIEGYDERIATPSRETLEDILQSSGIPIGIAKSLSDKLGEYAAERGWIRVERDILSRLERGEIGLQWFISKLLHDSSSAVTGDEFEQFLHDFEGRLQISERTFQLSLFLSNAYRIMKDNPGVMSVIPRVN